MLSTWLSTVVSTDLWIAARERGEGFVMRMEMKTGNIFSGGAGDDRGELCETLVEAKGVRIERIVSRGQASPEGFWYDQDRDEWVIILQGSAGLSIDGSSDMVIMRTGDYLLIPAHFRHRVEWTDPEEETLWIAVHYES